MPHQVNTCPGGESACCRSMVMGRQYPLPAVYGKAIHMQKCLAYDQLTGADRLLWIRTRRVADLRMEQGPPPFPEGHDMASLRHRLHGLLVSAMQAMEGAGRTVCDFTDAVPWEFTMDQARQVWDKARHVDIFMRLLAHVEDHIGESPETTTLWRCACAQTPEERVAGVNRGRQGLAGDVLAQLIALARQIGDPVIERALDCVLADESTHVRLGSKWRRELSANAPERLRKALELQQRIDE